MEKNFEEEKEERKKILLNLEKQLEKILEKINGKIILKIITILGNVGVGKSEIIKTLNQSKKIYDKFKEKCSFGEKINILLNGKIIFFEEKVKEWEKIGILKHWYSPNKNIKIISLIIHYFFEIEQISKIIKNNGNKIILERECLSNFYIFTKNFFNNKKEVLKEYFDNFNGILNLKKYLKGFNYILIDEKIKKIKENINKRKVSKKRKKLELKNIEMISTIIENNHKEFIKFYMKKSNKKIKKIFLNEDLIKIKFFLKKLMNYENIKNIQINFLKLNNFFIKKIGNFKKLIFLSDILKKLMKRFFKKFKELCLNFKINKKIFLNFKRNTFFIFLKNLKLILKTLLK